RRGDVADLGVEVAVAGEHEPGRLAKGLVGLPALASGLFRPGGTGLADSIGRPGRGRRRHETRRSRPVQNGWRSAARSTLPVALRGSSETTVTPVGHLNPASRSRAQLTSSAGSNPAAERSTAAARPA